MIPEILTPTVKKCDCFAMTPISIMDGEIFADERGTISCLNEFDLSKAKRFYLIHQPDPAVLRGWHGHRLEKKWFFCVKGSFCIGLVEINDWSQPSRDLVPEIITLSAKKSRIVAVPAGWASCIKAEEPDSILLVFSEKTFAEATAILDSYRFPADFWPLKKG